MDIFLDQIIVGIFLFILVSVSFYNIREIENFNAFALGRKTFSTFALGSTILATWISGSGFILDLSEFYFQGFAYFYASIGMCLTLTIVATILVPRMQRFLGKLSLATIMTEHYGKKVGIITAVSGLFVSSGSIYVQFKIMGMGLHYIFPFFSEMSCIFLSSCIVILYSFTGGINSVVTTDKIQAICFALAIVIGLTLILSKLNDTPTTITPERFRWDDFLHLDINNKIDIILLFLYFLIPGLKPDVIQRISMGLSLQQVKKSYLYSSFGLFIILCLSCLLSYCLFLINPNITDRTTIFSELLTVYDIKGTKAIVIIGLLAMCMSTADSKLNIASVIFANDIFFPNKTNKYQKLTIARYSTILIGFCAILFSFKDGFLLDIILFLMCFYTPIVTIPLFAIIFNKKTSERCCLISMICSFIFVLLFKLILKSNFNINVIALLLNLITLISSHYIIEKWNLLAYIGIKSHLKKE